MSEPPRPDEEVFVNGLTEGGGWEIPRRRTRRWPMIVALGALLVGGYVGYEARSTSPAPPRATQTITVAPNPTRVISDTQTLVDAMVAHAPCWFTFQGEFGHVPLRPVEQARINAAVKALASASGTTNVVVGKRAVGDSTYVLVMGERCPPS